MLRSTCRNQSIITFPFPLATEVLPTLVSLRSSCEISGQFICSNIYRLRIKQPPGKQNEPKSAVKKKSETPKFHMHSTSNFSFQQTYIGRVLVFSNTEDHAFYLLSVKGTTMINGNFGSGERPEALQRGGRRFTAHTGLRLRIRPTSHIPNYLIVW